MFLIRKNIIRVFCVAAVLSLIPELFAQGQGTHKLTYKIIRELDVVPVSEKNFCGEECGFELKIPYVKADSVVAAIPDLPSGVSFVSLRRSEYSDETSGTKIELWLTFSETGTYKLRFLRVTIDGAFYNIPFLPVTISENPRDMLPQLVVVFDNGTEFVRQKNVRQSSAAAFSAPAGTPLYFTVYLRYAVQLVSFYWTVPKNALFTELERYEITKGTLRNSDFSEDKIPVARFEWLPLVTGNVFLPEISLIVTSYSGGRTELSMPDSFIEIQNESRRPESAADSENYFSYAFAALPKKNTHSVKTTVTPDDCHTIARLRHAERTAAPFGKAVKDRRDYEQSLGVRNEVNEPTYFARNMFVCLSVVFFILLGTVILLRRIPLIIVCAAIGIFCLLMAVVSSVRLSTAHGIFIGGGIRPVPEAAVDIVGSIESGRMVKIEQKAGGWVCVRVGTADGWVKEDSVIIIE